MLEPLIKIAVVVFLLVTAAAYLVLLERWIAAWVQDRRGPNRVGIPLTKIRLWGLGQPLADGLKFLFKEEYTPAHVDKFLYIAAPISLLASALAVFAVIPLGSILPLEKPVRLVVAPGVDVGMIYVFAVSSIAVYGVVLGGWASNNKYSFIGGLRSSAQLIAYEIPLGLGLLGVVLASGSLNLEQIVAKQAATGLWNVLSQPIGFLVFAVAACAEAARLPFDLPEAEQELVGGYHTEYSGMKLVMFATAEFLHLIAAAVLIVVLFLGGWHFWGLTGPGEEIGWGGALLRVGVLIGKTFLVILAFMVIRWTWPRFRFDQLMALGWKAMLPLGMVNLVLVATIVEYFPHWPAQHAGLFCGGMWVLALCVWVAAAMLAPGPAQRNAPIAVPPVE
ncbi:MAG: NADH-quinone oxidoreductase subunit NuoH [Planctomycetia bacterium]|nr:NADH-quinone oxidoreductase subunit NuoH [Planctomycetia bacterium]